MVKFLKKLFWLFTPPFKSYKFVAVLGLAIRTFALPNPLEALNPDIHWIVWRLILVVIDSLILSNLLWLLSFGTVGTMYQRGANKAWGSILYTIFYTGYVCIIYFSTLYLSIVAFYIAGGIFLFVYVALFFISFFGTKTTHFNS